MDAAGTDSQSSRHTDSGAQLLEDTTVMRVQSYGNSLPQSRQTMYVFGSADATRPGVTGNVVRRWWQTSTALRTAWNMGWPRLQGILFLRFLLAVGSIGAEPEVL